MRKQGYIYAALGAMGWGTTFIAAKIAQTAVTPGTLLFIRYLIASLILLTIYRKRPRPKATAKEWGMVFVISFLGYFVAIYCQHLATNYLDASMASLLFVTTPVFVLVFAIPVLHEKPTLRKLIAIILTILGAGAVIGGGGENNSLLGFVIAAISITSWSFASVLIRRFCASFDVVWLTIYTQIIAAVFCLPLVAKQLIMGNAALGLVPVETPHLLAFLWAGVVSTAMANLFWNRGLELVDANTCSLFYAFMPLTTGILGSLILGEELGFNFLIGGLVIFAGLILAATGDKTSPLPKEME